MTAVDFQKNVLDWFDSHGRKNLPWQQAITPYRVWLSETMLQQTQVNSVIPYFLAFVERFPDVTSLAQAHIDEVLPYWSGLGYYARARNLHKAAQTIHQQRRFPDTLPELMALSGIGQSTAGAILSIAFHKAQPILDGNVKRVLTRYKGIHDWTGESHINKQLWAISAGLTPVERCADYTQAMMDLGATVCKRTKPLCLTCPLTNDCIARQTSTTALLPTAKPKKILPIKSAVFLLLKNQDQQLLLEKRPPVGIWGGLWSLPEFDNINALFDWCYHKNINTQNQQILPTLRHTFSHYHLDYTPVLIQSDNPINFVMEGRQTLWYNAQLMASLGLAAPIKHLLRQHTNETEYD